MNLSIIDCVNYPNKSFILKLADHGLTPLRIALQGRRITIAPERNLIQDESHRLGIRILAGFMALVIIPITLSALAIKWWKCEEWQKDGIWIPYQNEPDGGAIPKIEEVIEPINEEDFTAHLQRDKSLIQELDVKLGEPLPLSWREYGKRHGECNQTLDGFINDHKGADWPDQRPLYIQRLGTFSETDLKIIAITCDYLNIFHCIPIQLQDNILKMEELKEKYLLISKEKLEQFQSNPQGEERKIPRYQAWHQHRVDRIANSFPRDNGQYDGALILDVMHEVLQPALGENPKKAKQLIAFTSHDLFTPDLNNFVFGCASLMTGVGVWSEARFGNPADGTEAFKNCLMRMMKISAHEFGHMRGLPHCVDYECNIGGYMSLKELDSRPLLYCVQDMAKIAYLTQTPLLQMHQKLLNFFQNFNQTYGLNCDFSKEIRVLNARIQKLEEPLLK